MKLLLQVLLLFPLLTAAQEAVISGYIRNKNKLPIQNAVIFIEGSYTNGTTDSVGYFTFSTSPGNTKPIRISAIGYSTRTLSLHIEAHTILNITLEKDSKTIEEVVIQAGQFRVGNLSQSVLSPLDIVTTAGSNGNIIAALEKLPGAQLAGESGRLMVRGGDAHETQTYINGMHVAQPYSNATNGVPVRGRFSPFLFKGTNFSTGGYSAEYGNALSSILNLSTSLELEPAKTEISISTVALGLGNTQKWAKNMLSVNTNYTNMSPYSALIPQIIKWTTPYTQLSAEAILKNKGKNHFFNLYGAYSFEKMGIQDYDVTYDKTVETKINSNNAYLNTNYIYYLPQNWRWESGASYGYINKNIFYDQYAIPNTEHHLHIKSKWNKKVNAALQFSLGTEYFFDQRNEHISSATMPVFEYGYLQNHVATFATLNSRLWNRIYLEAGLRFSTDLHQNKALDPRLGLTYQINDKNQTSFAYGIFHQNAPEEILKYTDKLNWAQARHYIYNYNYASLGRQLRIELYHKKYNQLATYDTNNIAYNSNYETLGKGYAQGIDLFWKDNKTFRNFQYWLSYSLTDVRKKEQNYPSAAQPSYIAKHYIAIVTKYWISSWRSQVGMTNTYNTGRPYNNPNSIIFMSEKTKSRNDLSANWSYLLTSQKIIHLSVTNILGQSPIYGYKYSQTPNAQGSFTGTAILPTAKKFVFIGFFWTISRNKKDNNLDNL